jgi:hypothetical protein
LDSGTPVLAAMPPSVSPTWTVYVFGPVPDVVVDLVLDLDDDFFFVVVFAAGVVVDAVVAELLPLPLPLLLPLPLMIAISATITAISAKGAKKRAELLLAL